MLEYLGTVIEYLHRMLQYNYLNIKQCLTDSTAREFVLMRVLSILCGVVVLYVIISSL